MWDNVCLQKLSIPTPRRVNGNLKAETGLKAGIPEGFKELHYSS